MRNQTWPAISLLTRLEVEECMAKLEANMEEEPMGTYDVPIQQRMGIELCHK